MCKYLTVSVHAAYASFCDVLPAPFQSHGGRCHGGETLLLFCENAHVDYWNELRPSREVFPRAITQDLEVFDVIFIPGEENKESLLKF